MSNKLRWGKFWWSDWSDDPALALCSFAAQGLWMRLMCIAAQGTPYGHVTVNGKAPSLEQLAGLMRPRPKVERMARLIGELEAKGVAKRGACGCLFSSRMEADGHLARARTSAAKSMWEKKKQRNLHEQPDLFASTEVEAEAEAHTPNPSRGMRERGGARNGFAESAAHDMEVVADAEPADTHRGSASVVPIPRRAHGR